MKKISAKFGLKIGDTIEIGLDQNNEIIDSPNREWINTIKAKVIGSQYGSPLVYVDDKDTAKYNLNTFNLRYSESLIDPSCKKDVDIDNDQFYNLAGVWAYNKVGEDRPKNPIEKKWGVKIGDKIKVAVTKDNKIARAASTSGKSIIGRVVGGSESSLLVHYEDIGDVSGFTDGDMYDIHDSLGEDTTLIDATDNGDLTFSWITNKKCFEKIEETAEEKAKVKTVEPLPMTEERKSYIPQIGDKVLIERDEFGSLLEYSHQKPDPYGKYKPAVCTVVGVDKSQITVAIESTDQCGGAFSSYQRYIDKKYAETADKNKTYWNVFNYKPIPITLWGLKVGDEVEVGKTSYKTLIDDDVHAWSGKGVKGKVVGFELNSKGEAVTPLIYIDPASLKKSRIKTKEPYDFTVHGNHIASRFLHDESIDKEKGCFWYVYDQKAFKKIETIERDNGEKMSNNQNSKPEFWDMMKDDGKSALYRVAATQSTKGVKAGILKMMEGRGSDNGSLKALEEVLETEFGTALVSAILGMGLTYAPKISEDERVARLAQELRVNSMGTVGNAVAGIAMEHFVPVILNAVNSIPAEENQQVRIGDKHEEEEQEEQKEEGKRATA